MNALRTFNRLRPTDGQLDEVTSARILRSILPDGPCADSAGSTPDNETVWIDPFATGDPRFGRWSRGVAAAILIVGVGGVAALRGIGTQGSTARVANPVGAATALPSVENAVNTSVAPPVTDAPTTAASESTVPYEPPPGGLHVGGQVPLCGPLAADVYRCVLPMPYDASMPDARNEIGMTMFYLNDAAVVAGGCRTTTSDAREWLCYVGRRAVDEGTISGALLDTQQTDGLVRG